MVRAIIHDWTTNDDHQWIRHGIRLGELEKRRRWMILSLLCLEGLSSPQYQARFSGLPADDFPELDQLTRKGLASWNGDTLRLTERGLALSDVIGPWLVSDRVQRLMAETTLA
jgi:oxygen-independent coproporphyrinogen-3 oxidase